MITINDSVIYCLLKCTVSRIALGMRNNITDRQHEIDQHANHSVNRTCAAKIFDSQNWQRYNALTIKLLLTRINKVIYESEYYCCKEKTRYKHDPTKISRWTIKLGQTKVDSNNFCFVIFNSIHKETQKNEKVLLECGERHQLRVDCQHRIMKCC